MSFAISNLMPQSNEVLRDPHEHLLDVPDIPDPTFWIYMHQFKRQKSMNWALKRCTDIALSSMALIVLAPLLAVVALAIVIESPGSPIYRQKRIGLNRREFEIYKFRSMRKDADKQLENLLHLNQTNEGMFKLFDDPRVSRVGKFIRKYSIDELPQLINVIKGDMSLVGPRPPIEREVRAYKAWHHVRFATLPGLTGVWQTSGRSSVRTFDDVVKMDYYYIKNWTLLLDFKLILKTIPVVLLGKDAA